MRREQELLEEPRGVRPVPLRRTRVRHRLHDLVLGAKRRRAALGLGTHGAKRPEPERPRVVWRGRMGGAAGIGGGWWGQGAQGGGGGRGGGAAPNPGRGEAA